METWGLGAGKERGDGIRGADGESGGLGEGEVRCEAREGRLRVAEAVQEDENVERSAGGRGDYIEGEGGGEVGFCRESRWHCVGVLDGRFVDG